MRKKRKITHIYIKEHFKFDINKEKAIYLYLCGERMNKDQKKLLDNDTKFERYRDWREYQVTKYNMYSKESLIEFKKIINLYLRDIRRFKNYSQIFCTAFVSGILSNFLTKYFEVSGENILSIIIWTLSIPTLMAMLMIMIVKTFYQDEKYIPFYKDVKEIINELIEQK